MKIYTNVCMELFLTGLSARHILEPEAWSKYDVTQRMRKLKPKIDFKIVHRYLMCVKMRGSWFRLQHEAHSWDLRLVQFSMPEDIVK